MFSLTWTRHWFSLLFCSPVPVPSGILERVSTEDFFAFALGQTWLCHCFAYLYSRHLEARFVYTLKDLACQLNTAHTFGQNCSSPVNAEGNYWVGSTEITEGWSQTGRF